MTRTVPIIFMAFTIVFTLFMTTFIDEWVMAIQNTNNTKVVVNLKNHTISVVDKTTNETISTRTFATTSGNITTNNTLPGNAGNITTNNTLPGNAGNRTTNDNLTAKFKSLQGN
jgi:hypothetical protein